MFIHYFPKSSPLGAPNYGWVLMDSVSTEEAPPHAGVLFQTQSSVPALPLDKKCKMLHNVNLLTLECYQYSKNILHFTWIISIYVTVH